ncbi:MAG TPA: D-lyxose/D-mannose family sugar isomerase [Bacteroidales bacterium]|jgi:D-lyxose ketol-isomerase|nr:D-lyxose/D-mannose family sugar isomerase [Bacteroidales bacterium]
MKRSQVNSIISDAVNFFALHKFSLPEWAFRRSDQWAGKAETCSEIIENKLGWDITDFGSNDFNRIGLTLFTLRNGNFQKKDKTYCEKIMIAGEEQVTPMHFHWNKMEDIINRGGGNLVMILYNSTADGGLSDSDVEAGIDGVKTRIKAGEPLILKPGQSITLVPGLYHRFYGEKGKGPVLIGEVSMVNDDENDNRFYDKVGRFPEIEEDTEPLHLLVNDYIRYL